MRSASSRSPSPGASTHPDAANGKRIEVIDVLRGFALVGIALVNAAIDGNDSRIPEEAHLLTGLDRAALWLVLVFADNKFRALFSFLFGLGFAILSERIVARGQPIARTYARRMLVLLAIGTVHALVTFNSILPWYGLLGFLLLPVRRWPGKRIVALAVACLMLPWVTSAVRILGASVIETPAIDVAEASTASGSELSASESETRRIIRTGGVSEIALFHAVQMVELFSDPSSYLWAVSDPFPMFLIGFWLGRLRVFESIPEHRQTIRWVSGVALVLGLAGSIAHVSVVYFHDPASEPLNLWLRRFGSMLGPISSPVLTIGYIGAVALIGEHRSFRVLRPLAPFGRMALTNYVLETSVLMVLLYGIGFGLYGELKPFGACVAALATVCGLVLASHWWLNYYRSGPMEWLWRRLAQAGTKGVARVTTPNIDPIETR